MKVRNNRKISVSVSDKQSESPTPEDSDLVDQLITHSYEMQKSPHSYLTNKEIYQDILADRYSKEDLLKVGNAIEYYYQLLVQKLIDNNLVDEYIDNYDGKFDDVWIVKVEK